jgi:hypothetical protein
MAEHGICAWLYDPDKGLMVRPAFAQDIKAMGATHVRVVIKGSSVNVLNTTAYARALQVYKDAGLHILALLDFDFNRPWLEGRASRVFYPNIILSYQGNDRWNRWIKDSKRRAEEVARALHGLVDAWGIYNEPNLQGLLDETANVPPVATDKAPALSPHVFLSYGYEMALALRKGGATTVYLGALSWLSTAGNDPENPYCAKYLRTGLAYLHGTGVRLDVEHVWDGLMLNCEGWWTAAKAQAMAHAIRTVLAPYQVDYPLILGEWGEENHVLLHHQADVEPTHAALASVAQRMYFFCYQAAVPYDTRGWGCQLVTVKDGGYYPAFGPLDWRAPLETIYHRVP